MCPAVSGTASRKNSTLGECRSPSALPTSLRIRPLADSSAAAVDARASSSPYTV